MNHKIVATGPHHTAGPVSQRWTGANRFAARFNRMARAICLLAGMIGTMAGAAPVVVDHGNFPSQVVVAGNPAIAYLSGTTLKFARNAAADGSGAWTAVTVDATGAQFPSMAVVAGNPAIAYCKSGNLAFVRCSTSDGMGSWTTVTVDAAPNVGYVPSLAVVNGNPAISYFDGTNQDLKYARASTTTGAGAWSVLTVDSPGIVGTYTSMAIVAGKPAIAYTDSTNQDLKYARSTDVNGSGWILTTAHSAGYVGVSPSLAVVDGMPAIAYTDSTTVALRYARNSSADGSGAWSIVTAAPGGGLPSSLAVVHGRPAIAYHGDDGQVKFVQSTDADGAAWDSPLTVDSAGPGMDLYASLAVVAGRPTVSYSDFPSGELRWAKIGPLLGDADGFDVAVDGDVYCTATQPDGKIIIAGAFSSVGGVARTHIARLNADGSVDASFVAGPGGYYISGVGVQPDGKVLIAGAFYTLGGIYAPNLQRLNPDGTRDVGFSTEISTDVWALAIQPDGKILYGGGTSHPNLGRLNTDGSADPTFSADGNREVRSIAIQPDGKIVVGGFFDAVNGTPRSKVARLNADGSLDMAFNPGVTGEWVMDVALQSDGAILLGGNFSAVGGAPRSNVARLLPGAAGDVDPAFDPATNDIVTTMLVQANGDILLGGKFTSVSASGGGPSVPRGRIARFSAGGVLDARFDPGADGLVYCLAGSSDGHVFAGGAFTDMGGVARSRFARLLNDPATRALSVYGRDRVEWLRGGTTPEAQHVAFEISTDGGATYLPLGNGHRISGGWELSGLSLPRTGQVRARARLPGGLSGGSTGLVEAVASFHSPVEDLDLGIDGYVYATAEQPDGKTVIVGNFATVLGTPRRNVARLNPDGTLDMTFDPSPDYQVRCVAVQADGRILLGGIFTALQPAGAASPVARAGIARVYGDGTLDSGFHPVVSRFPSSSDLQSLVIQADGEILIGGNFDHIDGVARNNIARLHEDGSLDAGFDPNADYTVSTIAVQQDGRILLGGLFLNLRPNGAASPTACRALARVNADGSLDSSYSPGAALGSTDYILCIALQADGKALVSARVGGFQLLRLDTVGAIDPGFHFPLTDAFFSISLQGDRSILLAGGHSPGSVLRANPDGSLDPSFRVDGYPVGNVSSVSQKADGKVLAGGGFTSIGGVARTHLALLDNDPATQSLTVPSSSRVQWMRGGTSPEACGVTFDISTDGGASYTLLGAGIRISGGWELTGLGLPTHGFVRARARTTGGYSNGSSGLVEAVAEFGTPPGGADGLDLAITGTDVRAIAVQADGKTIIAGTFTSVLGVTRNKIARINADGSLDLSFNPDVTGGDGVFGIAVQHDGKIVIGGYFTSVCGTFRLHMARLMPDGSLDTGYDPHPENPIYCMAIQPDGKLLIGGAFATVGGAARPHLARLEESGVADPTFVADAPDSYLTSLAVQPDGAVIFGGYFTTVGATPRNHIARVSSTGTTDAAFNPNVNGSHVAALVVQPDGRILVGGAFSSVGGVPRSHFARIGPDGSPDLTFDPTPNNLIQGLALQTDGRILVAGDFSTLHPGGIGPVIIRHHFARLTSAGTVDPSFNPDANGLVYGAALQPDGKVLLGGEFTYVGATPRNRFARLLNDPATQDLANTGRGRVRWLRGGSSPETQDVTFDLSTDSGATYTRLGQGTRIAGGWELTGLSLPTSGLIRARARTTGGLWTNSTGMVETVAAVRATVDGLDPAMVGGWINVTAVQPDGGVIIAGQFTSVLGVPRRNAARIKADGTLDMAFDPSPNAIVSCAAVLPDGRVLLGGDFTEIQPNGSPTPQVMAHLVMLNPDGTADYSFGAGGLPPNPDAGVACITVQPDGKILLGGSFSSISGAAHSALARLNPDGSADSFDAAIIGDLNMVDSLVLQPDGQIVIGGYFTSVGGQPRNHIARVEADGTLDSDFHPNPDGYILSLALQTDGKILVGGQYASMNSAFRRNLCRLHPSGALDTTFKPEPNDSVWSLAVQADGKIVLGGAFTTLQPGGLIPAISRQHLARLRADGSLDPDFSNPTLDAEVNCVATRADGKIWLGGGFTTVAGVPRHSLALLTNDPATANLAKTGSYRLDWRRGGTSPEASDVTFELSGDGGVSYSLLGHGIRSASGWQITSLSLPSTGLVRARARVAGCSAGGSSGLVETVLNLSPPVVDPFEAWIADRLPSASPSNRAFMADPDHDGFQNGLEYYFGLDPAAASVNPITSNIGTTGITLTFVRASGLGALDATAVKWSTDLETWSHDGVVTTLLGPAGTGYESVSAFVPAALGGHLFVRIGVAQ